MDSIDQIQSAAVAHRLFPAGRRLRRENLAAASLTDSMNKAVTPRISPSQPEALVVTSSRFAWVLPCFLAAVAALPW